MKVVIKNGEIVDPVRNWDSKYYMDQLNSYGFVVSLPAIEPKDVLVYGDIRIMPVEIVKPSIDEVREELTESVTEIFNGKVVLTYGKKPKPIPVVEEKPVPIINQPYIGTNGKLYTEDLVIERKKYENQYLEITKQIIQLAGMQVEKDNWTKLSDQEYQDIGLKACLNNPAVGNFLLTSLAYVLNTLKIDFEWKWENVEFREEIINL